MEENVLSPGPPFTAIVMIQATRELPVTTVSKPTHTVFLLQLVCQGAHKPEKSFVRGHIV